jgi:hypothetical protein
MRSICATSIAMLRAAFFVPTAASTNGSSVRAYSAVHDPDAKRLTPSPRASPTKVPAVIKSLLYRRTYRGP